MKKWVSDYWTITLVSWDAFLAELGYTTHQRSPRRGNI